MIDAFVAAALATVTATGATAVTGAAAAFGVPVFGATALDASTFSAPAGPRGGHARGHRAPSVQFRTDVSVLPADHSPP